MQRREQAVFQKTRKWRKYSPAFRQQALEKMAACTNVAELARQLGIRRKHLYAWRDRALAAERAGLTNLPDPEIVRLEKRVAELERLAGRQAAEIDFFKGALRRIKERRQQSDACGGAASTTKSGK